MKRFRWINAVLLAGLLGGAGVAAQPTTSLAPLPAAEWDGAAAAHLLRRAAFGGTPAEVERLVALGPDDAVALLVDYQAMHYQPAPPAIPASLRRPLDRAALRDKSPEERRRAIQQRRRAERQALRDLQLWWLERLVDSPRPLEEKMTLFWHGHFTSEARKVRRSWLLHEQNDLLRRHALGNFRTLVREISRDPAMLIYLDNALNRKRRPNENYARELLELFTLGEGKYSEADIKAAARAFTGWSLDEHGFRFRRFQHDAGAKRFLGRTGKWDGDDIIEIILAQPECSRYLATKLLTYFHSPDPPRRLVYALAHEIREHDYELRPVLRTLFRSRAFHDPVVRGTLVRSPVELVVGTARQLGVPLTNLPGAQRALAAMGQELFQPPNVKGWDGGRKWITTATLFTRYNAIAKLVAGEQRGGSHPGGRMVLAREPARSSLKVFRVGDKLPERPAAQTRSGRYRQPAYDPLPTLRANGLDDAAAVVAFYGDHLLAVPLPAEKHAVLVEFLAGAAGSSWHARNAGERVRVMLQLLCSTPEFQVN